MKKCLCIAILLAGIALGAEKKNVLFILSDDQRADTIAAHGNTQIRTPSLDKLANEGTSFVNSYIMGGLCPAVCCPSRAMLLSGRTLWNIEEQKTFGCEISAKYQTLPQVFRNAGYETFHAGKWHQKEGSFMRSFDLAKGAWFGGTADHFRLKPYDYNSTTPIPPREERIAEQKKLKNGPRLTHSSEVFADAIICYLKQRKKAKPFFAYVAFFAPHDTRIAPEQYHDMYQPEQLALPPNFLPKHPFDNGEMRVRDEGLAQWPRTEKAVQKHLSDYYAIITHMDEQIGRIMDALKETGEYENTIIVFSSDNGLAIGSHGLMGKQNVYEHSVKVPMIFRGPGVPKGEKRESFCYLLDTYPTLCTMAGLAIPKEVQGINFAGSFTNPESKIRDQLYLSYMGIQRAVRYGQYKLIEYNVKGKRTTQLFDLEEDPFEMNNLASNAEYRQQLSDLRNRMQQMRKEYNDDKRLGRKFWNEEE